MALLSDDSNTAVVLSPGLIGENHIRLYQISPLKLTVLQKKYVTVEGYRGMLEEAVNEIGDRLSPTFLASINQSSPMDW